MVRSGWVTCGWVVVFLVVAAFAREFTSTDELYDELLGAEGYTFVYVYSVGCQWCQRLNPHFERLPGLFEEDGGRTSIGFARIDGRKSRNFARDFNIDSYPQLLLFEPGSGRRGSVEKPQDLLRGIYRGTKDTRAIAHYLTGMTGQMPRWPKARDNVNELSSPDSLARLQRQLNGHWRQWLNLSLPSDAVTEETPVLALFLLSPWMCARHQELLSENSPNSAVDQLSLESGSGVKLWRVDSSREQWAPLVNEFRASSAPRVVIMPQDNEMDSTVVVLDLLEYDREVWEHELELMSRLLKAVMEKDQDLLENMSQEFHSINFYSSLQDMQFQIQNGRDESIDEDQEDMAMGPLVSRICFM